MSHPHTTFPCDILSLFVGALLLRLTRSTLQSLAGSIFATMQGFQLGSFSCPWHQKNLSGWFPGSRKPLYAPRQVHKKPHKWMQRTSWDYFFGDISEKSKEIYNWKCQGVLEVGASVVFPRFFSPAFKKDVIIGRLCNIQLLNCRSNWREWCETFDLKNGKQMSTKTACNLRYTTFCF